MTSSEAFERVAQELSAGSLKQGLWLQCLVEAEGNQEKTKGLYAKKRAEELFSEAEEEQRVERARLLAIEQSIPANRKNIGVLKQMLESAGISDLASPLKSQLEALIHDLELTSDGVSRKASMAAERVVSAWRRKS